MTKNQMLTALRNVKQILENLEDAVIINSLRNTIDHEKGLNILQGLINAIRNNHMLECTISNLDFKG